MAERLTSGLERNKAVVRRFFDIVGTGAVDELDDLVADGFVDHTSLSEAPPGPGPLKEYVLQTRAAFPDIDDTLHLVVAEGDAVAVHGSGVGTHLGEFLGIAATGRRVTWTFSAFHRVHEGRIAERWVNIDMLGMLQQIGASPAP